MINYANFRIGMQYPLWLLKDMYKNHKDLLQILTYLDKTTNGGYRGKPTTLELAKEYDKVKPKEAATMFTNLEEVFSDDLDKFIPISKGKHLITNIPLAIESGYLKVDARGFYFTRNLEKRKEWFR